MEVGAEHLVDAFDCRAEALRDPTIVRGLLEDIVARLDLHVVGEAHWHVFPGEGGITGLYLLTESHLSIHTYPEHRTATLNLYCCKPREAFPWETELQKALGAERVLVRSLARGIPPADAYGSTAALT